ncbi:peptidoglycan recognition family protein [Megasphaera hutchinsoni]|jgi:hypothetical protein|uniref:N-acetylmuramoyl-L-alanine amidase n=1 Tax=Megasphaera hutchinsoni TaxID=1588748 RepID=A0A2J8B8J1_9FIRM|nr:peptidoglycan recognition family protein [Megasphaera genomosp. type_2]PNH21086.1 N-acetylmuramoyl-L-alanine amidase [Megasphaera genomosp. type_2]
MRDVSRKDFLCKSFLSIVSVTVGSALLPGIASASGLDIQKIIDETKPMSEAVKLRIHRPKLVFAEALQPRLETKRIIMHHVGGTNREAKAEEIHQWHLQNGWAGIGYHFIIHKDGSIEQGRPIEMIGAHCYRYNSDSVGICSIGNFQEYYPTDMQLETAGKLIAYVCSLYDIVPGKDTIFGHRDLNTTECPGDHLYAQLDNLRKVAFNYLQG